MTGGDGVSVPEADYQVVSIEDLARIRGAEWAGVVGHEVGLVVIGVPSLWRSVPRYRSSLDSVRSVIPSFAHFRRLSASAARQFLVTHGLEERRT